MSRKQKHVRARQAAQARAARNIKQLGTYSHANLAKTADQQLVSAWISKSVYNPGNENLGDIDDVVINKDGKVDAVVIGVGGFLGMGEKNVAVPVDKITATTDSDGRVKLALNATKEQLEAAPEFKTLADQRSEAPAAEAPAAPATPAPAQ